MELFFNFRAGYLGNEDVQDIIMHEYSLQLVLFGLLFHFSHYV